MFRAAKTAIPFGMAVLFGLMIDKTPRRRADSAAQETTA
jgi:hypothetical protein